jgi:hypothetical protein
MTSKSRALISAWVACFCLGLFILNSCAQSRLGTEAQSNPSPSPSPSPSPKLITTSELAKLRWIEGTWRGTGGGVPPFFERYKFENDSTLLAETLADETFTKVSEAGRFELKDGHFGKTEGESGSVAIALDDNSVTFAPLGKSRNSFRFQRESENSWKAILNWTAKDGTAKELTYLMERVSPAKP